MKVRVVLNLNIKGVCNFSLQETRVGCFEVQLFRKYVKDKERFHPSV